MFKVGDKVRIMGDYSDLTDHLHGMIGTITAPGALDCLVDVDDGEWMIWNYNMKLVSDSNE